MNINFLIKSITLLVVVLSGITDYRKREIPNFITFPFIFVMLIMNLMINNIKPSVIALLISFIFGFIFFAVGGMGGGDVKLMMGLATALGLYEFLIILFLASIIGVIWGGVTIIKNSKVMSYFKMQHTLYNIAFLKHYGHKQLLGGKKEKITVPFGSCLAIATLLTTLKI